MVSLISFSIFRSVAMPNMMLHSGSTTLWMTSAASCSSESLRSLPPVMLNRTPRAPSMETSSSGLVIAVCAALLARCSPTPQPMDIHAGPEFCMMDCTSAKSRLISPGTVISSAMDCTPIRRTSSAMRKAFCAVISSSHIICRRSFGITSRVSTCSLRRLMPSSAESARRLPSKAKGLVTTPTVSAPVSLAISAMTGAAPVPVPPPIPAATKTMSASRMTS